MAKIRVKGDTSGYIDVAAPATADNSTLDLSTVAKTTGATFTGQLSSTISSATDPAGYFRNTSGSGDSPALVARGGANNNNAPTFQVEDYAGNVDFKVDGNGRVTMPYQPSFRAWKTSSTSVGNVVSWQGTFHNIGNHFNTSTGVFTAPIQGIYLVGYYYLTENETNQVSAHVRLNGQQNNGIRLRSASSTGHQSTSATMAIQMQANDTIDIYVEGGGTFYGDASTTWSGFSAHLIG